MFTNKSCHGLRQRFISLAPFFPFECGILFSAGLAAVALLPLKSAFGSDGVNATGYLTYRLFDASGNTHRKEVMLFSVKVLTNAWTIRTEPAIERQGGLGYFEVSLSTNNSILRITASGKAYKGLESPFRTLRQQVQQLLKEDVFFAPPTPPFEMPERALPKTSSGRTMTNVVKHLNNVAFAVAQQGKYPTPDPSYAAFLWFAFTPPSIEEDGTNKLLLQIWDDGNRLRTRFRRATWTQFEEAPQLVSGASFCWAGKQVLENGTITQIKTTDVDDPFGRAAKYDVDGVTNISGFSYPIAFRLERFNTRPSTAGSNILVSSITASVAGITLISSDEMPKVQVPGKTFVNDYRLSAGDLKGTPLKYVLESNAPPSLKEVQDSKLYRGTLGILNPEPQKQFGR